MDEHLIFSEVPDSGGLVLHEVLVSFGEGAVNKDEDLTPVMSNGLVSKPVVVFKEGDYVTMRSGGKKTVFSATKERMEKWLRNTMRDVPINYDHNRTPGPNKTGWLRLRTGKAYVAQDSRDGKWALFAQPEFSEEALGYVTSGQYRDMSIEVDPQSDCLVGMALTNYPRVKTLTQFNDLENKMPNEDGVVVVTDSVTKEEFSALQAELAELRKREADRQAELEKERALRIKAEKLAEFSEWVQDNLILIKDGEDAGKSKLAIAHKELATEILYHASLTEDVLLFSDTENPISITEGIKSLLSGQAAMQVVGQMAPETTLEHKDLTEENQFVTHLKNTLKSHKKGKKKE